MQQLRDDKWTVLRCGLEEESIAFGSGLHKYGGNGEVKDHSQILYLNSLAGVIQWMSIYP